LFESKNNIDISEVKDRFKYYTSLKAYIKWCIKNDINIFGALEEVWEELKIPKEEFEKQIIDFIKRKKLFYWYWENEKDLKLYDLMEISLQKNK
jgi:hypothetical protein